MAAPRRDHLMLTERPAARGVVLCPQGELDLVGVPVLRARLEELRAEHAPVVVDLAGLTFIDSTGIRCLLTAQQDASRDGWDVRFHHGTGPVERVLRLSGLDRLLSFTDHR